MELPTSVLPEKVPGAPILIVILERNERIEDLENFAAHWTDVARRDDEDEVVAADVPHEPPRPHQSLHDIVQNPGQDIDDPIAVVVAVAIVELLEVVQIGVADRKLLV